MNDTLTDVAARKHRLQEVLLGYLQDPHVTVCPGGDGLTAEDVLESYRIAAAARRVPGRQELLGQHPELTAELEEFFGADDWLWAADEW